MLNVGLDVHQKYTYYTELDDIGTVIRQGRVANEDLPGLFSDGAERQVAWKRRATGTTWWTHSRTWCQRSSSLTL